MISSVTSATKASYLSPSSGSSSNGATTSFEDTLADVTTQGTLVSISEQAKAAAAASSTNAPVTAQTKADAAAKVASFDLNKSNIGVSKEDYNAYYAAGAAAVSAAQGLPAGQYDFSKLSPKEAHIVASDALQNHGASFADVAGLNAYGLLGTTFSGNSYSASNTPQDALSDMVNLSRTTTDANGENYGFNDTLTWMMSHQGSNISNKQQQSIDFALSKK